eukprot:GHVR01191547.1.p1 GENE.GHVR01191547.1~~GHVR01191547.1.p1  ORF type:complete len:217 (+),score=69.89 GHVR01191547.1:704-1354(+)
MAMAPTLSFHFCRELKTALSHTPYTSRNIGVACCVLIVGDTPVASVCSNPTCPCAHPVDVSLYPAPLATICQHHHQRHKWCTEAARLIESHTHTPLWLVASLLPCTRTRGPAVIAIAEHPQRVCVCGGARSTPQCVGFVTRVVVWLARENTTHTHIAGDTHTQITVDAHTDECGLVLCDVCEGDDPLPHTQQSVLDAARTAASHYCENLNTHTHTG